MFSLDAKVEGASGLVKLGKEMTEELTRAGKQAIADATQLMEAATKRYIYEQRGYMEVIWEPLRESTLEMKERQGLSLLTLIATSSMARSIESVITNGGYTGIVGTKQRSEKGFPYPLVHEGVLEGGPVERPFLWPAVLWKLDQVYSLWEWEMGKAFEKAGE